MRFQPRPGGGEGISQAGMGAELLRQKIQPEQRRWHGCVLARQEEARCLELRGSE